MTNSVRSYQASAAEGATHIDLLLSVYDRLAEDIRLAGQAAARKDIAARCRHSQHAMILLGHVESWVSFLNDAALEKHLSLFYAHIRRDLVRLQTVVDAGEFQDLAMQICETRAAWQSRRLQHEVAGDAKGGPPSERATRLSFVWTA